MANNTGVNPKPNQIQNTQTTSSNFDDSHIICGQIQTQPTWLSTDIHVKGNLIFEAPYSVPSSNQIISQDTSCSVSCNNGGQILFQSNQNIDMGGQFLQNCQPVYSCMILTHGKISVNDPINIYKFDIEQAEYQCNGAGDQFETIKIQVCQDVQQWASQYQFITTYDNSGVVSSMLSPSGDAFVINPTLQGMMKFTFKTCINYCFDGSISVQNSSRLMFCVFDKTIGKPIPQSVTFVHKNDQQHAYATLGCEFFYQLQQDSHELCPAVIYYGGQVKFSWQEYTPQVFCCEYFPKYIM